MITRTLDYQDGDTALEAYIAYAETDAQKPLVLVAHDWTGRREFACRAAEYVASLGYIGFALDMYGKGIFGADGDTEGNSALMAPYATDRALLRQRIRAALTAGRNIAQADATKVAAIGYCFGGMCVLELARGGADVAGVACIHGILAPGEIANEQLKAKVLCLQGFDDPMAPPEQIQAFQQEMTDASADWQVHVYGGTRHAFTNPVANDEELGTVFKEVAKDRAYRTLENFLQELF
ncbi:MAG: dienelactone hydrolase family protein [Gammaproteobacteria bacterium]